MGQEGRLEAGGDVRASFVRNAIIEGKGDLVVENDITTCSITVSGSASATKGKGRIQGGTVTCGERVEANQIGSALNVPTIIVLGERWAQCRERVVRRRQLERAIAEAEATNTGEEPHDGPESPAQPEGGDAEQSPRLQRMRLQLAELEQSETEQTDFLSWCLSAGVRVHGPTFPGTVVEIAGERLQVYERVDDVLFIYDPEHGAVRCVVQCSD